MIKEFSSHSNCLLPRGNNNNPIKYSPLLTEAHIWFFLYHTIYSTIKEAMLIVRHLQMNANSSWRTISINGFALKWDLWNKRTKYKTTKDFEMTFPNFSRNILVSSFGFHKYEWIDEALHLIDIELILSILSNYRLFFFCEKCRKIKYCVLAFLKIRMI